MGGGLIQLAAYGEEDLFLTKDPQITFFKYVYRRHTEFSYEAIEQYFSSKPNQPNFGTSANCTITKSGDLMGNIVLYIEIPAIKLNTNTNTKFAWVKKLGFAIIKSISITINGYEIDKHYGDWMNIWSEITGTITGNQSRGLNKMIGNEKELTDFSTTKNSYLLQIPLNFWFCRSSGSTLPLISLQYSDIKLNVEFAQATDCYKLSPTHYINCIDDISSFTNNEYIEQNINGDIRAGIFINYDINTKRLYYYKITKNPLIGIQSVPSNFDINNSTSVNSVFSSAQGQLYKIIGQTSKYSTFANILSNSSTYASSKINNLNITQAFLLIDYFFLDEEERSRFAKAKHDYIIEQLLYTPPIKIDDTNRNIRLDIDNPCKLMIWTVQMEYIYNSKDYFNYTDSYKNKLFFYEPYDVPLNSPVGSNIVLKTTILGNGVERLTLRNSQYFEYVQQLQHLKHTPETGINMYSYSLNPLNCVQPSGTFNTSQIDNIDIKLKLSQIVTANNNAIFRGYGLCFNIFRIINGLGALMFTK